MKARRVTEITIQKDEAFVIRRPAASVQAHCPGCGTFVALITPDEASFLFGLPVRSIYRGVETAQLHFQESAAGAVLLCLDSAQRFATQLSQRSNSQLKNKKEISS